VVVSAGRHNTLRDLTHYGLRAGWHTFDFILVDFFFIDRMLKIGVRARMPAISSTTRCRVAERLIKIQGFHIVDIVDTVTIVPKKNN